MSSVDYVEININNIWNNKNIVIDIKRNLVIIDGVSKKISDDKIDEFFRIVRTWKNKYTKNNIIDSEKFTIRIISNHNEEIISGSGNYPNNYLELNSWVDEIYEWNII